MKINFITLTNLLEGLTKLSEMQLPFKLSLIVAKNLALLEKEHEFYINQEREFALKYLEIQDGQFVQESTGVFKIKAGLEDECHIAREELNNFEVNVDLRLIPVSLCEHLDISPKVLMNLESILDEEG